jgi:hypothetical protein
MWFSILLLTSLSLNALAADKMLDLTGPYENDDTLAEMSLLGVPAPPPVPFPVEVTLQEIWPINVSHADRVTVEILLRNIGQEAIAIPASRKYRDVFKPGNRDQRMFDISLELKAVGPGAEKRPTVGQTVAVIAGSADVSGSMIALDPGQTLSIRVTESLAEAWAFRRAGHMIVPVTARASVR